ncbi:MAG: DUF3854 domain-containing protein [Alkalinema sp. FL-bin-369]|nr:DUF3854 domain-containing protein [Leptolyngbyaceae cyanobacterium LF-bin-369]
MPVTDLANLPRDRDLVEFRDSAIPDALTLANVRFVEGREALTAFRPLDTTSPGLDLGRGRDAWKKWTGTEQGGAIGQGGWIAFGCTPDGRTATIPYFKPKKPRDSEGAGGKVKLVKYETPSGSEASPILPFVDEETVEALYDHQGGQPFWPTIRRISQPIAIVEGLKKALALIAHGVPAIAIRGITQWHQKGSKQLHPLIAELLSPGQTVYIIFDQDAKASTQKAVRHQMSELGVAVEGVGCVPLAVGWDEAIGKGIDDALFLRGHRAKDWLESILDTAVPPHEALPAAEAKTANATRLSQIVDGCDIWQTDDRTAMIDIPINRHKESIGINEPRFRSWLAAEFYQRTGRHCSSDALGQLIERLRGQAISAPEYEIFHRVAKIGDEIYLDIGDRNHTVIKICGAGWGVLEGECPAKFRRPNSMKALPMPSKDADWSGLKDILNLQDKDWVLLMTWLSWGLYPDRPHPILILNGEQGTGKSKTSELLKRLIDPAKALLLSMPEDARALKSHANNRWCLTYDNLSGLSSRMSDLLCRVATKSGFSERALYTDDDESVFDGVRPIILNGIEAMATRPDLLDRSIILNLSPIDDDHRMTEEAWENCLTDCQSHVLGSMLNALAQGLRRKSNVRPIALARMADFHVWGHCVESAFDFEPGAFEIAYQANRNLIHETAIDNDAIATALLQLLEVQNFMGSASELLSKLGAIVTDEQRKAPDWIKSPRVLGRRLARLAPELRKHGIEIRTGFRIAGVRTIALELIPKAPEIISSIEEETIVEEYFYEEPTAPLEVGEDVVFADSDDPERNKVHYKLLEFDRNSGSCTIELQRTNNEANPRLISRFEWLKRRIA